MAGIANAGRGALKEMAILKMLETGFLWPGDFVRRQLGITVDQDGGLIRSFVNMAVWGAIALLIALRFFM